MASRKQREPTYGLHKATGQARVYLNGRDHYLGEYGSDESWDRYYDILKNLQKGQSIDPPGRSRRSSEPRVEDSGPSVAELLIAFLEHAKSYYVKDGKQTAELNCFKSAMKPVNDLYGRLSAKDFSPVHLKAVREQFIKNKWTRGFCNKSVCRVRQIWRWGVGDGLIPAMTLHGLEAVTALQPGRTSAPDRKRREAVSDEHIEAVRLQLKQHHRDLFDLMRATGARPSELIGLTMADIDTTRAIWLADLDEHKNSHRGLPRTLYFGPKSQLILRRLPSTGPLFNFCRKTFSAVVKVACEEAGVPPFVPYQLRHTKATELRDMMGIESAQATLGHAQPSMTARYSSKMGKLAIDAASRCG